jgi:hypothetical protein
MILTPTHASYPSGHSTEGFICAIVLGMLLNEIGSTPSVAFSPNPQYLDPRWREQLLRLAARIAINRTVAGVHFPVDSAAGAVLGMTLGHYLVCRCNGDGRYEAHLFDGTTFPDTGDFVWTEIYDHTKVPPQDNPFKRPVYVTAIGDENISGDRSPMLQKLWRRAKAEWT